MEYALETIQNLVESENGDPNDLGLQLKYNSNQALFREARSVHGYMCVLCVVYCGNI